MAIIDKHHMTADLRFVTLLVTLKTQYYLIFESLCCMVSKYRMLWHALKGSLYDLTGNHNGTRNPIQKIIIQFAVKYS